MSLSRRQEKLIEIALDRIDSIPSPDRRRTIEYILDQLVEGGSPEYHAGERPARDDKEVGALIDTLRLHMRGLPELSEIPLDKP